MTTGLFASNFATADSMAPATGDTAQSQLSATNIANTAPDSNPASKSKPALSNESQAANKPAGVFPHLERALIIVTIVNLLVIIGGLATYLLKRRMQQFMPVPMASINHDR